MKNIKQKQKQINRLKVLYTTAMFRKKQTAKAVTQLIEMIEIMESLDIDKRIQCFGNPSFDFISENYNTYNSLDMSGIICLEHGYFSIKIYENGKIVDTYLLKDFNKLKLISTDFILSFKSILQFIIYEADHNQNISDDIIMLKKYFKTL